jgi:hypothetical protein
MSRLFPNPETKWNGSKHPARVETPEDSAEGKDANGHRDLLDLELCKSPASSHPGIKKPSASERGTGGEGTDLQREATDSGRSELEQLRLENADLRILVLELQNRLENSVEPGDASWEERQREYESLLEEKSEVIRSLHRKIQELQERPGGGSAGGGGGPVPREQELLALSEELERERRQLKEDEEALMQQMREMEVQMSRERAELARQRNEVIRLQSEIRHELELASRDAALRERLAPLQRRHQELTNRRGSGPPPPDPPANGPAPQAPAAPVAEQQPRAKKDSGLFSRLFGQGE